MQIFIHPFSYKWRLYRGKSWFSQLRWRFNPKMRLKSRRKISHAGILLDFPSGNFFFRCQAFRRIQEASLFSTSVPSARRLKINRRWNWNRIWIYPATRRHTQTEPFPYFRKRIRRVVYVSFARQQQVKPYLLYNLLSDSN